MKNTIALVVAILLMFSGCAQTVQADVPKDVLEKYDQNKAYAGHRTLSVCSKGGERIYSVGFNVEADGPMYYYDKNGDFLGTMSFGIVHSDKQSAGIPPDVREYICELLNESGDIKPMPVP